nr:YhcH/YjgK/YiaL family protein [Halodesulfovibrio sp. MK-HDV]
MILDVLEHAARYESLSPYFADAFAFLRRGDLRELADGQYEIVGRSLFATVVHQKGKAVEDAKLEAHDEYIDIQFVIQGNEQVAGNLGERLLCLLKSRKSTLMCIFTMMFRLAGIPFCRDHLLSFFLKTHTCLLFRMMRFIRLFSK